MLQAYISGNAAILLKGPKEILQTIYIDDVDELEAVAIEENSGRIAVCSKEHVYIYGPIGRTEGVLKVPRTSGYRNASIDVSIVVAYTRLVHQRHTARLDSVVGVSRRATRWG